MRYALTLLALTTACATSPGTPTTTPASGAVVPAAAAAAPAPAAVNPVGIFEFSTTGPDGAPMKGVITTTANAGRYTGKLDTDVMGSFDVSDVQVAGQEATFFITVPDGTVEMKVTFNGNDFAGKWSSPGGQGGVVTGKRKS